MTPRQTAQAWIDEVTEHGDSNFGEMTAIPDSITDATRWVDVYDRLRARTELPLVDFSNGEKAYWAYLESGPRDDGAAIREFAFHHRVGQSADGVRHVLTYVDDPEGGEERWLIGHVSSTGGRRDNGELEFIRHEARDQHKMQAYIQDWSDKEIELLRAVYMKDIVEFALSEKRWAASSTVELECVDDGTGRVSDI